MSNKDMETLFIKRMTSPILDSMYEDSDGGAVLVINNTKEDIDDLDFEYVYSFADTFLENRRAKEFEIIFSFFGYDNDPREVYEIPEIVYYTKQVFEKKPWLFYFINKESKKLVAIIHSMEMIESKDTVNTRIGINGRRLWEFFNRITSEIDELEMLSVYESINFKKELNTIFQV